MTIAVEQVGASPGAIQSHYDVGNEFYQLWLDDTMCYSSALWQPGDTLARAQRRKLEHHAREARASRASSVLDIGCGWGGMLRYLLDEAGVQQVTGLTLSVAQARYVSERAQPGVSVRLEGWEQHQPAEPYEAIISVGALEHFARMEMSTEERVANYRAFFVRCRDFLQPEKWLSIQTFAYCAQGARERAHSSAGTKFLGTSVFLETDPPTFMELVQAWDGLFELVRVRNDRLHYARTCREWLDNLRRARREAVGIVGEQVVSRYERYLQLSTIGFQSGRLDLYRITLRRRA